MDDLPSSDQRGRDSRGGSRGQGGKGQGGKGQGGKGQAARAKAAKAKAAKAKEAPGGAAAREVTVTLTIRRPSSRLHWRRCWHVYRRPSAGCSS
jgi:hypothetical protein